MKLKLTFEAEKNVELPIHYNYILQGFIYNNLAKPFADFLHNEGYRYGNQIFKLITFSKIYGRKKILKKEKKIIFSPSFHIYISAIDTHILQNIAVELIQKENLRLHRNFISLKSVETIKEPVTSTKTILKTISPITVHESLNRKTMYYNPYQEKFYKLLEENLRKKVAVITGNKNAEILIKPVEGTKYKKIITYYKNNFVIEAWDGKFQIEAPPEIIKIALSTGIGARNSQGFGMVAVSEECNERRN
ncbi:CRISPR-associated endoribonuclease Cas6 [Desulfurobacterium indicum]|uniref:CRISPR-associated endoribonuclease n=1 Tax=Desulfurobacterium indicum TaxID=1914305 RepID=A0A1R1MJC4_9BACT|nr:CRISPR-associated endoribonuclease Cas6 [Desulfurobacterium indicum]OMH39863.1 CRISPR-associated endoribonuclease Cas6 [Desulfurobacterium indicum]